MDNYTTKEDFYLHNIYGEEYFNFSENYGLLAKWNKLENDTIFDVEIVKICGDFIFELETKFPTTIIEKLADIKYKVTMTAWNPLTIKAIFPLTKIQLQKPDLINTYKLFFDKEVLEKIKVDEYFEKQVIVYDFIDLEYSIRRESSTAYVVELKCQNYDLENAETCVGNNPLIYPIWCDLIEFEYPMPQYTKHESIKKESTVTFWLDTKARHTVNKKVLIKNRGNELDMAKLELCKFGNFDIKIEGNDGSVDMHKNKLGEKSKVFKNMFEAENLLSVTVTYSVKLLQHVLAYVYCNAKEFHCLETELIKFAKQFEMNDLKDDCIESLEESFSPENICRITKFAYDNKLETLLKKCQNYLFIIRGDKMSKENLQTLTGDMIFNCK